MTKDRLCCQLEHVLLGPLAKRVDVRPAAVANVKVVHQPRVQLAQLFIADLVRFLWSLGARVGVLGRRLREPSEQQQHDLALARTKLPL